MKAEDYTPESGREILERLNTRASGETDAEKMQPSIEGNAPAKQKEEEEKQRQKELEQNKQDLKAAIQEQAQEGETRKTKTLTLNKILGGDILTTQIIRQQIGILLIIVLFTMIYISNGYSCKKSLIEIDKLNQELLDAKYRALSSSSQLTEKCRESNVLKILHATKDSTLHIANQPPYLIQVPQE